MALYDNIYLYANGGLLAENTTVEIALESDDQDAETTVKGWAGITPSPDTIRITAENLIPLPGVEFDFEQKKLDREEVEMWAQEGGSGKMLKTKGYIMEATRRGGVGQNTVYSITFKGTPGKFE